MLSNECMSRNNGTAGMVKAGPINGKTNTKSRLKTPSPPHSTSDSDHGESDHSPDDAGERNPSEPPIQKPSRVNVDLNEEEVMVEFLRDHELLYKKLQDCRDKNKKESKLAKDGKFSRQTPSDVRVRENLQSVSFMPSSTVALCSYGRDCHCC